MITALMMTAALSLTSPSLSLPQAASAPAQAPAPASSPVAPASPPVENFPILEPAVPAMDCGGLLKTAAYCISADLTKLGALADQYVDAMAQSGWLAADGDDNRVIFVRRKPDGTCDGMQMVAFYDESRPVGPTTLGYLGFAQIPGNICRAPAAAGQVPEPQ